MKCSKLAKHVNIVLSRLEEYYGRPVNNPDMNPLDELIITVLSQSTSAINYKRAFSSLKEKFSTWEAVFYADFEEVESSIHSCGLSHVKTEYIKSILNRVYQYNEKFDLDFLYDMTDDDILEFLLQFKGVGLKTASCVMLFSLGRNIFPVDTHIHRISKRLEFLPKDVAPVETHVFMNRVIPPDNKYSAHINMVSHGRKICKAINPLCDVCPVLDYCKTGDLYL